MNVLNHRPSSSFIIRCISLLLLVCIISFAQDVSEIYSNDVIKVSWTTLTNIKYEEKYFEATDMEMLAPIFTDELKALDGQSVEIEGYVIPLDEKGYEIALSANPYASCFFCGRADAASVMSIYLRDKKRKFKVDMYLHFIGTLKLNYDDPLEFYYILEDAIVYPE